MLVCWWWFDSSFVLLKSFGCQHCHCLAVQFPEWLDILVQAYPACPVNWPLKRVLLCFCHSPTLYLPQIKANSVLVMCSYLYSGSECTNFTTCQFSLNRNIHSALLTVSPEKSIRPKRHISELFDLQISEEPGLHTDCIVVQKLQGLSKTDKQLNIRDVCHAFLSKFDGVILRIGDSLSPF